VIPFDILLNLNVDGLKISGYFKLTWIRIRLLQSKFPDKKEVKREEDNKQFDFKKLPRIISLLYQSSPYILRIFNALLKSSRFERFNMNLKLGLGSPYNTALISGYLFALIPLLNLIPEIYLSFEPDFHKEKLNATMNLKIKIRLLRIVIELLKALTKKPVRSLIKELRTMR